MNYIYVMHSIPRLPGEGEGEGDGEGKGRQNDAGRTTPAERPPAERPRRSRGGQNDEARPGGAKRPAGGTRRATLAALGQRRDHGFVDPGAVSLGRQPHPEASDDVLRQSQVTLECIGDEPEVADDRRGVHVLA